MTGTCSSRARVLSRRLILAICSCRLSRDSSAIDELDIIDHDQAEILPQLEPAGVGGDLEHVPGGRVVDEQRAQFRSSSTPLPRRVISRVPRYLPVRSLWPSTRERAQRSRSASSELAHFEADERARGSC